MKSNKCVVCNAKFESKRSDAQYCSNSCKQKGSVLKKAIKDKQVPKQKKQFSVFEYDRVVDVVGFLDDMDFIAYCYFRQALPISASIDQISTYINRICNETVRDIKRSKSFEEFVESFCVECEVVG